MKIKGGFLKMHFMVYLYVAGPSLGVIALFTLGYIIRRLHKKIKNSRKGSSNTEESTEKSPAHSVIFEVEANEDRKRSKTDDLVTYPETLKIEPFCSIAFKITEGDKQLNYSLFGVVAHSGSLDFGHYVAYIKTTQRSSGDCNEQLCKQTSFDDPEKNKDVIESILEERKENNKSFENNSNENKNNDNMHTKLTIIPEINMEDRTMWYYINDATVTACKREEAIDNRNAYILLYVKT